MKSPSEIRQARFQRVRLIRRRVVAGAVALFIAAWLLIATVLVTGHDPALVKNAAATSTNATSGSSTPLTSSSSGSTGSSSSSSSSQSSPSGLTTQQS